MSAMYGWYTDGSQSYREYYFSSILSKGTRIELKGDWQFFTKPLNEPLYVSSLFSSFFF